MDDALTVIVNRKADEPVYQQIARQIRGLVASGVLAPGDTLPGIRVVASDLGVNLNTVARAYRVLAEEGFLEIRHRRGVEVARPRASGPPSEQDALRQDLRTVLARLRQRGLGRREILELAAREIRALGKLRRRERKEPP